MAAQELGSRSGVTVIYPNGETAKEVRCDQDTNGGGWTILLLRQRQEQQLKFDRRFDAYYEGFGEPSGEYWIGEYVWPMSVYILNSQMHLTRL